MLKGCADECRDVLCSWQFLEEMMSVETFWKGDDQLWNVFKKPFFEFFLAL